MAASTAPTYSARVVRELEHSKGTWKVIDVEVVRTADGQVVGEYRRNYPVLYRTFASFRSGERELALYSPDYTGTRVLSLPDCTDIGGEPRRAGGFCPTDFYVPQDEEGHPVCGLAFVAGCIWGDDSSWKVQVIDLSDVGRGNIRREERFGYIELPAKMPLHEAVRVHKEPWMFEADDARRPEWTVEIAVVHRFRLDDGAPVEIDPFA